jgi:hypothetical protein
LLTSPMMTSIPSIEYGDQWSSVEQDGPRHDSPNPSI